MAAKQNGGRPYVFPALKVDGEVYPEQITIANTGQDILRAQQEAAKKIRQIRAAAATVPTEGDSAEVKESTVPAAGDSDLNSGASAVNGRAVLSTADVEPTIREWLAAHLPSSEQLFSASASLVGLQGIDQRVRDLVASFQEQLDGYRQDFTAWRDQVTQQWAALVDQANALMEGWRDQVEETGRWRQQQEAELKKFVSTLRGPQGKVGNTGMAGAAVTVVDRLPKGKGVDFTRPFLERDAVVGDIVIDATTDMRYGWRWDGQGWERGPAMTSLQVRDVRVNSVQGAPQYTSLNISQAGAGGGGGGIERLMINRAAVGLGSVEAFNSFKWASVSDPRSFTLQLDLRALDGAMAGKSSFCLISCTWDGVDTSTEYAVLGDLSSAIEVELSVQRAPAVLPGGLTGVSIPPGTQGLRVFLRILPVTGMVGSVNNCLVSGGVTWSHDSLGRSVDVGSVGAALTPLWVDI